MEEEEKDEEEPLSTVQSGLHTFLERSRYIPLRLSADERRYLHLLEAALSVSAYTDKVRCSRADAQTPLQPPDTPRKQGDSESQEQRSVPSRSVPHLYLSRLPDASRCPQQNNSMGCVWHRIIVTGHHGGSARAGGHPELAQQDPAGAHPGEGHLRHPERPGGGPGLPQGAGPRRQPQLRRQQRVLPGALSAGMPPHAPVTCAAVQLLLGPMDASWCTQRGLALSLHVCRDMHPLAEERDRACV